MPIDAAEINRYHAHKSGRSAKRRIMAVFMSLGGNSAGDGFLLAPYASNYEAEIALWTDAGTTSVTVQPDPAHNVAGLVFSTAAPISISTVPVIVTVHAMLQSA